MIKHICSLGTICHTARLLQRIHKKKVSYPFDWVFTDFNIISHAIRDDFKSFLDRTLYIDVKNNFGKSCGHKLYHEDFFFHKDPRNNSDYEYYQRCVERFREMCKSEDSKLFILFISPEFTKHPKEISDMLIEDIPKEDIINKIKENSRSLNLILNEYTHNFRLLVIINFGYNNTQTYEKISENNIDFLILNTLYPSQGVTFNDTHSSDNYFISGIIFELYPFL